MSLNLQKLAVAMLVTCVPMACFCVNEGTLRLGCPRMEDKGLRGILECQLLSFSGPRSP